MNNPADNSDAPADPPPADAPPADAAELPGIDEIIAAFRDPDEPPSVSMVYKASLLILC